MSYRLSALALGAFAFFSAAPPASAGSCCQCAWNPCAPMVQWAPRAYYSATQFYVVNEGPTFSGPGIVTLPPNYYPYVSGCCTDQTPIMPYHYRHGMAYPQVMSEQQFLPEESYEDDSVLVAPRPRYRRVTHHYRPHPVYHRPLRVLLPRDK